jgi:DNA-binding IclR family transcriptional regulator
MMNDRRGEIQSVDRAISVLELLARSGWAGVTEVASALAIHKSTAYRLLATLKERGLVDQDPHSERYRLGLGLVFLASSVTAELDLVRSARPVCERLSQQTQETVTLSILAGEETLILFQTSASVSVLNVDWTGKRFPLHCTSDGKVLLAHLPASRQEEMVSQPLEQFTPHTVTDPARLRELLRKIRAQGYGYVVDELEVGLTGVGAPIYASGGAVVAAISVSGPSFRLPESAISRIGELTKEAAAEISRRLGFQHKAA